MAKSFKTVYDAVEIIEELVPSTSGDYLRAWAYLIRTGTVWQLQGFYGRGATDLIDNGIISSTGRVQWTEVDKYIEKVDQIAFNSYDEALI